MTNKLPQIDLYDGLGPSFNKRLTKFLKKEDSIYVMNEMAKKRFGVTWQPTAPASNVFIEKLYILTNGRSFSATGEVAGMLRTHRKDAIFIGEEVGGNPVENTSGVMAAIRLPNSQIRAILSLIRFEVNVDFPNDGFGVKPDYPIKNTIEQEINGEDSVMQWTLDFIKKQTD